MMKLRNFLNKLTRPAPLQEFDNYDGYWEARLKLEGEPPLLYRHRHIAQKLSPGASVLDIGCGEGVFLRHLRETRPDCTAVGADISSGAVERLRGDGFECVLLEPYLPLEQHFDQCFDYVVMMEVLEHVHEAEEFALQGARLAKHQLFVTLPNVGFFRHRLRLGLFGRFPITNIQCHMKEHIRFWSLTDFAEWCQHLGLKLRSVSAQWDKSDGKLSYWLVNWRPNLFAQQVIYEINTTSEPRTILEKSDTVLRDQ